MDLIESNKNSVGEQILSAALGKTKPHKGRDLGSTQALYAMSGEGL
jgi:hypothetical protein